MKVKKILIFGAASFAFVAPAFAQARLNAGQMNTPSAIVRIPRSSLPGAGMDGVAPQPSTRSMYPAPIRQSYDPAFVDPTAKNPNLRQR
jgi:hypothetical protein